MANNRSYFLIALSPLFFAGVACTPMRLVPFPLYPEPVLPQEQVAMLSGPIATVDGADVPRKPSYALLPGCHVVVLQTEIGEGNSDGAWSVHLKRTVYTFQMKAGNIYSVEVQLESGGGSASVGNAGVGGAKIIAVERDSNGHAIGAIVPTHDRAAIEACRTAEPAPSPTAPTAPAPVPEPSPSAPPAPAPPPEPTPSTHFET